MINSTLLRRLEYPHLQSKITPCKKSVMHSTVLRARLVHASSHAASSELVRFRGSDCRGWVLGGFELV